MECESYRTWSFLCMHVRVCLGHFLLVPVLRRFKSSLYSLYSVAHPLVRYILLNAFWGIPSAGGLIVLQPTTQSGPCNSKRKA